MIRAAHSAACAGTWNSSRLSRNLSQISDSIFNLRTVASLPFLRWTAVSSAESSLLRVATIDGCLGRFESLESRLKDGCIPLGIESLSLRNDMFNGAIQRDWRLSGENINMPLKVNNFVAWNRRLKLCSLG